MDLFYELSKITRRRCRVQRLYSFVNAHDTVLIAGTGIKLQELLQNVVRKRNETIKHQL